MQHLPLLLFLFVLLVGFGFIGLFSYIRIRYDQPLARIYLVQLIAYSFFLVLQSLSLYGFINTQLYSDFWQAIIANTILSIYFIGPLIYYQGKMFFYISGVAWKKNIQYFFLTLAFIPVSIATLVLLRMLRPELGVLSMLVWFLAQSGYYIILGIRFKSIEDPLLKYIAVILFIFPLIFIPVAIIDGAFQAIQIKHGAYPMGIMGQPIIYLISNILSLLILIKARKLYKVQQDILPRLFIQQFNISDREKDIIALLNQGLSNKEIASKLFLSASTVRNHISNIFEKTGAASRGKLQNMIAKFQS